MYTNRGKYIFSPSTFEHSPFTRYSYGKPVTVTIGRIKELQLTSPRAYVHVLYDDGFNKRFIQVRNIKFEELD